MHASVVIPLQQDLTKNQITPTKSLNKAHGNSIESLAVHPNEKNFATGSHDRLIKLWDAATFKQTMTLADHKQGVWTLDYSPDGSLLASGGPDKSVLIWDSKKSSPGVRISGHKDKVYCARFNESGRLLASGGEQGEIFIWDIAKTRQPLKRFEADSLIVYDLEWSKSDEFIFGTTLGSQLLAIQTKQWNQIASSQVTEGAKSSKCESCAANFKLIDRRVFCATSRGFIAWYQLRGKSLIKQTQFFGHFDAVRTVNYHPRRRVLLSSGRDGSVRLWNAARDNEDPTILGNLALHLQNVPAIGFLSEEIVVTGSWDQKLAIWNVSELLK